MPPLAPLHVKRPPLTSCKASIHDLLLAHGPSGFENPDYRKLLTNGIRWAAAAKMELPR
jgi:type 1 glutamine amidotransferase